jgi:hypothetical protein
MASEGKVDAPGVLDGFNKHDPDAIMAHFAEDCVFESPRGPTAAGAASPARTRCAAGLPRALRAFPMFTAAMTITSPAGPGGVLVDHQRHHRDGQRIEVRGCDLRAFGPDGKIVRKDSFWKLRDACPCLTPGGRARGARGAIGCPLALAAPWLTRLCAVHDHAGGSPAGARAEDPRTGSGHTPVLGSLMAPGPGTGATRAGARGGLVGHYAAAGGHTG